MFFPESLYSVLKYIPGGNTILKSMEGFHSTTDWYDIRISDGAVNLIAAETGLSQESVRSYAYPEDHRISIQLPDPKSEPNHPQVVYQKLKKSNSILLYQSTAYSKQEFEAISKLMNNN